MREKQRMSMSTTARLSMIAMIALGGSASADVNLEFRVDDNIVDPGDTVPVHIYIVGDPGPPAETVGAIEAIFTWDTVHLLLDGVDPANPANLIFAGFPAVGTGGLNEANPPADGDGIFVGLGPLGTPTPAAEAGTLFATLHFTAVFSTPNTDISFLASAGTPLRETVVFDGTTPNTVVTGTLSGTSLIIRCGPFDAAVPFGQLDLADVAVFTTGFLATDPVADLNEDNIFDLADIDIFITGFLNGCPLPPAP
jgi:hypothetical protein